MKVACLLCQHFNLLFFLLLQRRRRTRAESHPPDPAKKEPHSRIHSTTEQRRLRFDLGTVPDPYFDPIHFVHALKPPTTCLYPFPIVSRDCMKQGDNRHLPNALFEFRQDLLNHQSDGLFHGP